MNFKLVNIHELQHNCLLLHKRLKTAYIQSKIDKYNKLIPKYFWWLGFKDHFLNINSTKYWGNDYFGEYDFAREIMDIRPEELQDREVLISEENYRIIYDN